MQLGDVTKWRDWDIDWASIDLLIGGSPCQGFSFAGKQLAFDDPRSALFFVYVDILNHIKSVNPKVKFMLENVRMKKDHMQVITDHLGVEPEFINSALVSAQNRQRFYWCNWIVSQPEDKGIMLADILETDGCGTIKQHGTWKEKADKSQCIDANYHKGVDNHGQRTMVGMAYNRKDGLIGPINKAYSLNASDWRGLNRNQTQTAVVGRVVGRKINPETGKRDDYNDSLESVQRFEPRTDGKSGTLTTVQKDNVVKCLNSRSGERRTYQQDRIYSQEGKMVALTSSLGGRYNVSSDGHSYRKLTPVECERLQTVPDNYTASVSNTQRYKMLGNGWTVDVIVHILSQMQSS